MDATITGQKNTFGYYLNLVRQAHYPRVTPGLPQGYPDITPPSNQWVTVKYAEGNIEVKIPKLFELNDNHTRNLQATCKKVSLDLDQSRIDKEEEEDQERETGAVSRRAHAEPNTLPGVQEPDPEAPSVDPLAGLPDLDAYHDTLRAWIEAQIAPAKLPRPGSAGWVKERDTLAKLHRRDCYPVEDIMGALTWMFTTDDRDAVFWRGVVKAIQPLRDKKKGDALNKFGKILDRWKGVKPAGPKLTYGMTLADLADIPENSFRRRPKEEPKP